MRITIHADGVTTKELRDLTAACWRERVDGPRVRCDGPEKWTVDTVALLPGQFARIFGRLVTLNGVPIADAIPFAVLTEEG